MWHVLFLRYTTGLHGLLMYNLNADTVKISWKTSNRSTENFLWDLQKATIKSYSSGKKGKHPINLASHNSGPLVLISNYLTVWN